MSKIPSPCIDVCKYRLRGHCIGCSMTEIQKAAFKSLPEPEQRAFVLGLPAQQAALGGMFRGWSMAYRRKCAKKGVACPLDLPDEAA